MNTYGIAAGQANVASGCAQCTGGVHFEFGQTMLSDCDICPDPTQQGQDQCTNTNVCSPGHTKDSGGCCIECPKQFAGYYVTKQCKYWVLDGDSPDRSVKAHSTCSGGATRVHTIQGWGSAPHWRCVSVVEDTVPAISGCDDGYMPSEVDIVPLLTTEGNIIAINPAVQTHDFYADLVPDTTTGSIKVFATGEQSFDVSSLGLGIAHVGGFWSWEGNRFYVILANGMLSRVTRNNVAWDAEPEWSSRSKSFTSEPISDAIGVRHVCAAVPETQVPPDAESAQKYDRVLMYCAFQATNMADDQLVRINSYGYRYPMAHSGTNRRTIGLFFHAYTNRLIFTHTSAGPGSNPTPDSLSIELVRLSSAYFFDHTVKEANGQSKVRIQLEGSMAQLDLRGAAQHPMEGHIYFYSWTSNDMSALALYKWENSDLDSSYLPASTPPSRVEPTAAGDPFRMLYTGATSQAAPHQLFIRDNARFYVHDPVANEVFTHKDCIQCDTCVVWKEYETMECSQYHNRTCERCRNCTGLPDSTGVSDGVFEDNIGLRYTGGCDGKVDTSSCAPCTTCSEDYYIIATDICNGDSNDDISENDLNHCAFCEADCADLEYAPTKCDGSARFNQRNASCRSCLGVRDPINHPNTVCPPQTYMDAGNDNNFCTGDGFTHPSDGKCSVCEYEDGAELACPVGKAPDPSKPGFCTGNTRNPRQTCIDCIGCAPGEMITGGCDESTNVSTCAACPGCDPGEHIVNQCDGTLLDDVY